VKVKLDDLEATTNILFQHLRDLGVTEFEISDDYYWDVPADALYDPLKDPSTLDLGQLSHDHERLLAIQAGKNEPISYGFVWLSAILRWVGQRIVH